MRLARQEMAGDYIGTGSSFHRVIKCKESSCESVVRQIMQYDRTDLTVPAVMWGRQMEDTARQSYLTETLIQETLPMAEVFFMDHLLPELICRCKDPNLAEEIQCLCLSCKRPSFGKMIACPDCCQHFHYACVNITRYSKKWKCGCK